MAYDIPRVGFRLLNLSSGADELADDLDELLPVSFEILVRLGNDFLHTSSILRLEGWELWPKNHRNASSLSRLIKRAGALPTGASSEKSGRMTEFFRQVPYPRLNLPRFLRPPVVRMCRFYVPADRRVPHGPCSSDCIPTCSSLNRKSSPIWNCAMSYRSARPMGSQILGREVIMGSWYPLRRFARRTRSTRGKLTGYVTVVLSQRCTQRAS